MPYLETFIDTTIKGIWDWRYPTTTLWLEARTNELEDCYLAGMQAFLGKLWSKLADEAGLEPKSLLFKNWEAVEIWQHLL